MSAHLTRERLCEILERCAGLRVAVIGDFNLDAYWYADMTRAELSREAPLFNRPVVRETYSPGGAANVAWNLAALGVAETYALTIFGPDWRGELLGQRLAENGVRLDHVLARPECSTPLFGKVFLTAHGQAQEDARLDFINPAPLTAEAEDALLAEAEKLLPRLHALAIADYAQVGMITARVRARLVALAQAHPETVMVVDSRCHVDEYQGIALKPNEIEAARALFPDRPAASVDLDTLIVAARRWQQQVGRPIYITRGGEGCLLVAAEGTVSLPGVHVPPPIDPVGAGDTFMSALAAGLAAGASPVEAGALGNLAAAVTVRKLKITGAATPAEILALYDANRR